MRFTRSLTVGITAAASLSYEILLIRIFAIEYFGHIAYMAIGVAMLGFGASGTLLAVVGDRISSMRTRWFVWGALLTPVALTASPTLIHLVHLDPTQLATDSGQWFRLALVSLLLAVPFATAAMVILLGLTLEPERLGAVYGASFLGSGMGAILAVGASAVVMPERLLAVPAVLGSAAAVMAARGPRRWTARLAWATVIGSVIVLAKPPWRLSVTAYKGLPQVEAYPGARRVAEHASPLGWLVAVEAAAFRFAPGLSLSYRGEFPKQTGLFLDGQLAGATAAWETDSTAASLLDWIPTALPYALGQRRRVLVIGAGGGTDAWSATHHGAQTITAVEIHPDMVREQTAASNSRIQWVVADGRSYIARSRSQFDLITLGPAGGFATSTAGVHSLNEDFLHTVDAYAASLELLAPDGVLAITRWLTVPPRESVRVILTAGQALHRVSPGRAAHGLLVARSWATATVMMKPSGFTQGEVGALREWADRRGFDIDWHPGLVAPDTRYHFLDEPTLFRAAAAAAEGPSEIEEFASTYPFDVAPADDARPYPHHFLRAGSVDDFLRNSRGTWLPFAEWGYIILIATLVQSVVLAGALLILPVALRSRGSQRPELFPIVSYFAAIGFAYLAAEIAAIQQLSLLLGHPVYAVAAVLAAFLVCSGIGSMWSDRIGMQRCWMATTLLVTMLALLAAALLGVVHAFQAFPLAVRLLVGVIAVAPVAFLMGLPFPVGLRGLAGGDSRRTAWAWATNGFASVVAAPLAALIALESGSRVVFVVAAGGYAVAAIIQRSAVWTALRA